MQRLRRLLIASVGIFLALSAFFEGPAVLGFALDGEEDQLLVQQNTSETTTSDPKQNAADDLTQDSQEEGNSSSNDQNSQDSEEPAKKVQVTFPKDQNITVPYGVDVASWLSKHLTFVVDGKQTSAQELSDTYFDGKAIFVRKTDVSSYPANPSDGSAINWSDYLAFSQLGQNVDANTVLLPSLSELKATMSWTNTGSPDDVKLLPLVPEAALKTLHGVRADGSEAALATTGTWADGTLCVWLNADDEDASPVALSVAGEELDELSETFTLSADGSFKTGGSVDVQDSCTVYGRLKRDMQVRDAQNVEHVLYQGQLVAIPVARDVSSPSISNLSVVSPTGEPADFSADGVVNNGVVTVTRNGLVITASIDEPEPAEGSDERSSGIDPQSLILKVGDKSITATSFSDGKVSFTLSVDTLGEGVWSLSDMTITAADYAGNTTSCVVGNEAPFISAGVTQLEIFDEESEANQAEVTLLINGEPVNDDEPYVAQSASGVNLTMQVSDVNFEDAQTYDDLAKWEDKFVAGDVTSTSTAPLLYSDFSNVPGTNTWRTQPIAITGEGTHSIDFTYRGKRVLFGWIVLERSVQCTVVIDNTAPVATEAQIKDGDSINEDEEIATVDNTTYLVGGPRTIKVHLADLLNGSSQGTSGVDTNSITATVARNQDLAGTPGITNNYSTADEGGLTVDKDGWLEIPLSGEGVYSLSQITLSFKDCAGNKVQNLSLADIVHAMADKSGWTTSDGKVITEVVVDNPEIDRASADISLAEPEDAPASLEHGTYRGDVKAQIVIRDPWFELYRATKTGSTAHVFAGSLEPGASSLTAGVQTIDTPALADFTDNDGDGTWSCEIPLPENEAGLPVEGDYDLALSYGGIACADDPATDSVAFKIDRTAPSITAASLAETLDPANELACMDDGSSYVVGRSRTLRIRVQDLLRGQRPDAQTDNAEKRDQPHTSGVNTQAVRVHLSRADGMTAPDNPLMPSHVTTETLEIMPDNAGWIEVPLDKEGLYRLDGITFELPDNAGNGSESVVSLAAAISALPEEDRAAWMLSGDLLTGIIVDDPATVPQVGVSISDGTDSNGNPIPTSLDPLFHRGQTDVEVWVADPWFDAWRHIAERTDDFSTVMFTPAGASVEEALLPVDPQKMTYDASSNRWKVVYSLPQVSEDDSRPQEGMYSVDIAYQGISGTHENPLCDPAPAVFGVDYTGPQLGRLELSELSPLQYGWIFSRGNEDFTVGVTDNLSGIKEDSGYVNPTGTLTQDDVPVTYEGTDGLERSLIGTLSFGFGKDAQRLTFSGTTLALTDRAGNPTTSASLDAWNGEGGTNIPEGATGVSIDTEAPVLEVSYDNNDVRNGHYYAASRTATITLIESNFDIARAHDKNNELVIARVGRDGNSVARLCSEDFQNPSADGKTWVATYTFEDDADWTLDAAYTDLAGRVAQPYATSFVVDTQAPSIVVQWDNNDVANGMYYKAPRNASIEVNDRNFSPDYAAVETTATDASGAGVSAPGASAWTQLEPRQKWGCSVSFASELHYTMRITATDLAGNSAETYEEPEFVIDMTAPVVSISNVSQFAAYSDVVAPTISYSDTNFDPTFTTYLLTGGRSGANAYVNGINEQDEATSRTVSFPDFEHTLEMDDVYVLDAQMTDLAGNQAQQSVTFSVNRYGSTYLLTDESGNMLGSYLNRPQDVVVHEINPSGLDQNAGHAEVVHDSEVASLTPNADYQVGTGIDSDSWSDTTYTFPARLFNEDGYYRILLTSHDLAGNLSQNTMDAKNVNRDDTAEIAFAIDSTAPTADLVGITSYGVYLDPQKTVMVSTGDNLAIAHVEVLIDGEQIDSWENPSESDLSTPSVALEADGEPHDIELVVVDRAGNQSRITYDGVVVTGDLLTFVLNTPRLLFGSVAGVIVAAAVAALGIALALRHHRLTRDKNNPFGHTAQR